MEITNDREQPHPEETAADPPTRERDAESTERAERQLEEGKRRLTETLEGDLNVTLGE